MGVRGKGDFWKQPGKEMVGNSDIEGRKSNERFD